MEDQKFDQGICKQMKNEASDYGNDVNEMIRGREYDQIRGEMN